MTVPSIWWFVSDLHLQAQATDGRGTGQVFPEFVSGEVLTGARPDRHLVLALLSLAGSRAFHTSAGSCAHLADEAGTRAGARAPATEVTRENLGRRVRLACWRARTGDGGGPSPGVASGRPPMAPHRPPAAAVGSGPEASRRPSRLR